MKPKKIITAAQHAWLNEIGVDTHWLATPSNEFNVASAVSSTKSTKAPIPRAVRDVDNNVPLAKDQTIAFQATADLAGIDSLAKLYAVINADIGNAGVAAQAVFGSGQAQQPRYMLIGEQPGLDDSAAGKPFAGDQTRLLEAIFKAVELPEAKSCFMTNLIKYRLPNGAQPDASQINHFLAYLKHEIALVQPQNIIALGSIAAGALLNGPNPKDVRGQMHFYQLSPAVQVPLWISHQPMALLVHGARKDQAWRDFVAIAKYNKS